MSVVELNRGIVGERFERAEFIKVAAGQILKRGRREKILLPEPKLLSLGGGIVGVKNT